MMEGRQAVRAERAERRKLVAETLGDDLEQLLRRRHVLQPVTPERAVDESSQRAVAG